MLLCPIPPPISPLHHTTAHRMWFWQQPAPSDTAHPDVEAVTVYGSTILLGVGSSTLLVTSLSMVADLIGATVVRLEYVYSHLFHKLASSVHVHVCVERQAVHVDYYTQAIHILYMYMYM